MAQDNGCIDGILQEQLQGDENSLQYVAQEDEHPTDGLEANWDEPLAQMIDHIPHWISPVEEDGDTHDLTFMVDNKTFFNKLAEICCDHACWTYPKPFLHNMSGCRAFLALNNHYLGLNNINKLAAMVKQKLNATTYHGEAQCWDLEWHVTVHHEQHMIIQGLTHHGHADITEWSKTCYLMNGIRANTLDSMKTQILVDMEL